MAVFEQEEITTIFVVGFPDDVCEREFHNCFTFARGFESAILKVPEAEEHAGYGRKQIIGFAKFQTRLDATEAKNTLTGRKLDADKHCMLKAEFAKKNLHSKRLDVKSMQSVYSHEKSDVFPIRRALTPLGITELPQPHLSASHNVSLYIHSPPTIPLALPPQEYPFSHSRSHSSTAHSFNDPHSHSTYTPPPFVSMYHDMLHTPELTPPASSGHSRQASASTHLFSLEAASQEFHFQGDKHIASHFSSDSSSLSMNFQADPHLIDRRFTPELAPYTKAFASDALHQHPSKAHEALSPHFKATFNSLQFHDTSFNLDQRDSLAHQAFNGESREALAHQAFNGESREALAHQAFKAETRETLAQQAFNGESRDSLAQHAFNADQSSLSHHLSPHFSSDAALTTPINLGFLQDQPPQTIDALNTQLTQLSLPDWPPFRTCDQNAPCNTLYVGNLPPSTTPEELEALFSKTLGYRRLCFRNRPSGPMCFVEFEEVGYATRVMYELYGWPLSGHTKGGIRLSYSKNPLGVRLVPQSDFNATVPI